MLNNDKITLRALEPEDLDKLYIWENNTQLWTVGNTRNPYSRYMLKQYILTADKDIYENRQLRLMIVNSTTGETVGTVDLFDFDIHNSRIALGLYVEPSFQGQGLAKSALALIEDYVFNFLHINQLYCDIAASNTASRCMFEKANYETNGVLKNWIRVPHGYEDIIVFQRFNPSKINL